MTLDTVSLEDAVKLLSLPRVVGVAEDGEEITAQNGRYGPYLKKGTDSRSLTAEDQNLTITLDEALKIYAQPKQRGRAAAAAPLKELGNDPVSGQPVVVKAGRFGEYVTDGEYNATLRKEDTVESITIERAAELLEERRARGPAKKAAKKGAKKAPAKKATTKKAAAKKTTKKAAAKKSDPSGVPKPPNGRNCGRWTARAEVSGRLSARRRAGSRSSAAETPGLITASHPFPSRVSSRR